MEDLKKYTHLSEWYIDKIKENVKNNNTNNLLEMFNEILKEKSNLYFKGLIYSGVEIVTYKNNKTVNKVNIDESEIHFNEIKEAANSLQHLYQDYESNIKTVIKLTDIWDEQRNK